ncbi:hypothetical protein QFZ74_000544 [Streptomyces sp. V3I7]|nr:hypothetical protein [Streptomyces sp. V3I7]
MAYGSSGAATSAGSSRAMATLSTAHVTISATRPQVRAAGTPLPRFMDAYRRPPLRATGSTAIRTNWHTSRPTTVAQTVPIPHRRDGGPRVPRLE